ncbi:MAG: betaine/proline/choline family ABC transporter ATP-binding protein [Firmicutes bacterium]|nr:betaine/proline/choline family ABC transporter ATP-binding protein [Bacillota bacterium]
MISFERVCKSYGQTPVLDEISFKVRPGQLVVLIGPSGCGKTTTLKTINRLIEIDKGNIYINDRDIAQTDRVKLRRSIGYVIQQIGLFPHMNVEQNISVVPKLLKYDRQRCKKITHEMLNLVDMPYEDYAHKYPNQLSGGQQQRIGVLRALAASPPIVLMDEPFGALDPMTRHVLQEELRRLHKKLKKTIVFVTHDMDEALAMADIIIFMEEGRITQKASPDEILRNPANDLIRSFMGKRSLENENLPQTAADIMRDNVVTASKSRGVRDSVELMSRRNIDTLILTNPDDTFAGVVSVDKIKRKGKGHKNVETLMEVNYPFFYEDEDGQAAFDKLIDEGVNYVVVLRRDHTVAGIITKTSMARSMADAVWGNGE